MRAPAHQERQRSTLIRRSSLPTDVEPTGRRTTVEWTSPPFRGRGLTLLAAGWLLLSAVTTGLGLTLVEWWDGSEPGDADADVNRWWEARRTPWLDDIATLGSAFSDTRTMLLIGLPLMPLFLWWFGRWHEFGLIAAGLMVETAVYLVPSRLVGRARPPVEQIAGPINDHSFPSGHVAAAIVFYGALAVIVVWHTEHTWAHATWQAIALVVPVWVGWSRVYIGAHHVTDYIGSLMIGVGALVVAARSVRTHDGVGPPDSIDGNLR
jgi:membrane-associated phospholipid phosphatase